MIETLRKMLAEATPRTWRTAKITADGPHHNEPAGVCPPYLWAVVCDPAPNSVEQAGANAALIANTMNTLSALLDAAEAWRDYLSAQKIIDNAGQMDNFTDAARARDMQAKAIDRARRALAALAGREGT